MDPTPWTLVFQQQPETAAPWTGLLLPLVILAIFYVLVIGPANKRRKNLQRAVEALKKGDRVVTTGGLYGDVVSAEGSVVILKIADNVRVKVAKSGIAGVESESETGEKRS